MVNHSQQKQTYHEQSIKLPPALTNALESLSRQHQLTFNTLMQETWAVLLKYYTDHKDLVFGSTVSARPPSLVDIENMVGMFVTLYQWLKSKTKNIWLKNKNFNKRDSTNSKISQLNLFQEQSRSKL